jgi:hypothetical protein
MNTNNVPNDNEVDHYEIRLKGHLADRWISRFGDVSITLEQNGITLLTFPVVDQAALFGLLKKVRDVGLPLLSVNRIESGNISAGEERPINHIQSNKGDKK